MESEAPPWLLGGPRDGARNTRLWGAADWHPAHLQTIKMQAQFVRFVTVRSITNRIKPGSHNQRQHPALRFLRNVALYQRLRVSLSSNVSKTRCLILMHSPNENT